MMANKTTIILFAIFMAVLVFHETQAGVAPSRNSRNLGLTAVDFGNELSKSVNTKIGKKIKKGWKKTFG